MRKLRATQENRAVFEDRRAELEKAATDLLTVAQGRARSLQELTITIVVKAGEEGKLYGSVGTQDIADVVSEQREPVTKSEVRLPEGVIRVLGDYTIDLQLHSDVTVPIELSVVAE